VAAHPATVESISITREYIRARTAYGLRGWRTRLQQWAGSLRRRQTGSATEDERFEDSAHSLARIVRWVERFALLATVVAVFFSAHAMVGRLIVSQERDALAKFQEFTKSADANRIGLFRVTGADAIVKPESPEHTCPSVYQEAGQPQPNHDGVPTIPGSRDEPQTASAQIAGIGDPPTAAQEAAWGLITACRSVQWALMQLVSENVRLKRSSQSRN